MGTFLQQVVNGLRIGSIYALIALGYDLNFGVLNVLSFAHGALVMLGAYAMLLALAVLDLGYLPAAASRPGSAANDDRPVRGQGSDRRP
jgi:branched-chain amino acid transport system permease protein